MEKNSLRNKELFELDSSHSKTIPADLRNFLVQAEFPWNVLGDNLARFVRQAVESVSPAMRMQGKVSPLAYLENPDQIYVGEGAVIEAFAFVQGPAYISPGAVVRHGAYVRGNVYACAGSIVGHTTEAKGTLLLPGAKAAHFAYLGDSVLGVECNLGAGTKLANLRLDHGQVNVRIAGEKIATGLKKFGAILGNRSQTGCNSVTNPGTILLPDALSLPNSNPTGIIRARGK
jgi:UDP-N-acetylglucosamine diphosphorylase / glucose-1-phosphate thymidylyltransferase / UDP-N-acetylgalactosamine diphosphorylase / glucosamine-1-phosphate N-acetyltransferase / galactosamine-1-phosphate N-acetyltransferase